MSALPPKADIDLRAFLVGDGVPYGVDALRTGPRAHLQARDRIQSRLRQKFATRPDPPSRLFMLRIFDGWHFLDCHRCTVVLAA